MMPEIPKIDELLADDEVIRRPSWSDPQFMLATNEYVVSNFTQVAGQVTRIVGGNPQRWAIGFQCVLAAVPVWTYSPDNDPQTYGVQIGQGLKGDWYTIFDFGPTVQGEWYGFSAGNPVIRVREILIR